MSTERVGWRVRWHVRRTAAGAGLLAAALLCAGCDPRHPPKPKAFNTVSAQATQAATA